MPQALPAIGTFLGASAANAAAVGATVATTAASIGANAVVQQRAQKAQSRIAGAELAQRQALATADRVKQMQDAEQQRQAARTQNRLEVASATGVRNNALRAKGIAPRPVGRFPQVTANVLDEGAVG